MFNQYILILVWLALMLLLINSRNFYRVECVCGKSEWRLQWVIALIVMIPIILMATYRSMYVGDTIMYQRDYLLMPESFKDIPLYISGVAKDQGFYLYSAIIKALFGVDYKIYFFLIATLQALIVVWLYRKYSCNYMFSIFLFIVSTDYISWMFNGIRQFTAVAVTLFAIPFILKESEKPLWGKYVPVFLIVLFASTIHQSALLVIPFVLIVQGEAWNKKTLFFIFLVLMAVLFVGEFTNILDGALTGTQYENMVSDYTSWEDDGTNPLRVIIYSVPAMLSFFGRKIIQSENNKVINFCTNMSIISAGLYLISMVTSGIMIGRLPIYCSLYSYVLLPWEIENLFTKESKNIVYIGIIGFYLLYYYYQMHSVYILI